MPIDCCFYTSLYFASKETNLYQVFYIKYISLACNENIQCLIAKKKKDLHSNRHFKSSCGEVKLGRLVKPMLTHTATHTHTHSCLGYNFPSVWIASVCVWEST